MNKKLDLWLMILWPIFATLSSLFLNLGFIVSSFLFFGVPSIYLSFRNKTRVKKTLIFSLIFSIPAAIFVDYFAEKDGSWFVSEPTFSYKILEYVFVDGIIWMFLITYFVLIFYRYFLDDNEKVKSNKNFKKLEILLLALMALVFIIHFFFRDFYIPYFYLILGIIFILIPIIFLLLKKPRFLSRAVKVSLYSFGYFILHEITGLQLGHWIFPGENFVGWVNLFNYSFPLEEFIFFISLMSVSIVFYYEFFDGDEK